MIPCGEAKVNRIAGFFRAWRGVFAGACPSAPCVVGLPKRCPRGGVLSLSPAYPAFSLLSFPPSPKGKDIPPPALAERSSPPGKGEIFSFLMQGASPLASPGLHPSGTYSPSKTGTQRRACPRRHWLALPRGRGPSQTPPSLATDSSISPGPPSPWLPALPTERRVLSVLRRNAGSPLRRAPAWQGL